MDAVAFPIIEIVANPLPLSVLEVARWKNGAVSRVVLHRITRDGIAASTDVHPEFFVAFQFDAGRNDYAAILVAERVGVETGGVNSGEKGLFSQGDGE